jgi:hypothetical protein
VSVVKFLGAATVVVALGLGVAWILSRQGGDYIFDLEVGQCFDEPVAWSTGEGTDVVTVEVVDCDGLHDAEVVGVGLLNVDGSDEYPADDELFAVIDDRCAQIEGLPVDRFGILPVAPSVATWRTLDGRYLCVAIPYGGEPTAGRISGG